MLQSSSASVRTRPRNARMMRVVLVGSPEACARLRADVDGAFAIVGVYPDLRSARAAAGDADAFLVAAESAGSGDPAYISEDIAAGSRDTADIGSSADISEDPTYTEPLTDREIEVLGLLAEGLSNKGIAARLGISDQTVKFHVASISGKLGTHTRTETVRRAVRRGLITL